MPMSTSGSITRPIAGAPFVPVLSVVGANDPCHQRMAHHIVVGEMDEADAVDARKHVDRVAQPGTCSRWAIDLTEIPLHHNSHHPADAGPKHLHLNRPGGSPPAR